MESPSQSVAWWRLWLTHLESSIRTSDFDPALSAQIDHAHNVIAHLERLEAAR